MSDSDDTDLLLLIPPDFFAVDSSESEDSSLPRRNSGYKHTHFDKLISQLNELEDRVNFIESKENITTENLSDASRLNHSVDYSVSYDSSKYHNICSGDLALRFYSLTSTGFSFGNGNDNDIPCIESGDINPSSNVIMPYPTSHTNVTSDKSLENISSSKSYDRNPTIGLSSASYPISTSGGVEVDYMSAPSNVLKYKAKDSKYTHHFIPSTHNFSFLNEIDEYLEGKYKDNNERLLPNFVTSIRNSQNSSNYSGESTKENVSKTSTYLTATKMSPLEQSEKRNVELDQVDKLLFEVESAHLDMKNKLQPSYEKSTFINHSVDNEQKFVTDCPQIIKHKSTADGIQKVTDYVNNYTVHPSRVCAELIDKSYKTHDLPGKQSDILLSEYLRTAYTDTQFLNSQSNSKEQLINPNVNVVDPSDKSIFSTENKEYCTQEKTLKPIFERFHNPSNSEVLNLPGGKEISSKTCEQAYSEISELRKTQNGNDENSIKHCQTFKHVDEPSIPKFSSRNIPTETLSSPHTNTETMSGHASVHIEGTRGKTVRPVLQDDGYYSSVGACSSTANLLSLSGLWGKDKKTRQGLDILSIEQKLQEEHYRRKHCENVIQDLQRNILEQQQKLTVAVRVDQSKDYTIQQLQSAWKRLASHWQELEEQRNALSIQCSEEKEKYQRDTSEMIQKIKWYENEVSKALNIAHGYKEKYDELEQKIKAQENTFTEERKALEASVAKEHTHFLETKKEWDNLCYEMTETKKKFESLEKDAAKDKELSLKAEEDAKTMQNALRNLELDLANVKEENSSLQLRLKEERSRNEIGSQQMKKLQATLDERIEKEKSLEAELKERLSHLEKMKSDLRDYYQQQVEIVVQEKLIEFQTQLDAAEASLHQEMEQKENLALQTASKQIKLITEKNLLEVKLLEEKHKEELKLYSLQLTQAMQQIGHLQSQLQSYSNRKVEIVEKLHCVMETQWQEALRIISGNSPVVQHLQVQHATLERNNEVYNMPSKDIKYTAAFGDCDNIPLLPVTRSSGSSTTDEEPFNKEDILTYRPSSEVQGNEGVKLQEENPDLIKKYIEALLNRPPGNPLKEESSDCQNIIETPVCEGRSLPKWEKVMENQRIQGSERQNFPSSAEDVKYTNTFLKEIKSNKPPWK